MDVIEKLFSDLESNSLQLAEESKKRLYDYFALTKESWLVNGMMDYFGQTNSSRIVDVLVKVPPPHDKYIFDRMSDWLQHASHRNQSITLFGHIVKKHPSWLYKVASHPFLKDILKLLKCDSNIITAMNALFCIIILLPIIPTAMPQYLGDLFEIFQHLAAWNCHHQPRLTEDQTIHLQIGLSAYFQRLYGMYPCNFVAYLRDHVMKEHAAVFAHTIRPLLETVKMHPSLLTSNRELEKANARWKEMEPHDVVVECSRFALDYQTRCATAASGVSFSGTGNGSRSAAVGFAGEMLAAAGGAAAISDCPYYKMMSGRAIVETPISQQLRRLLKSTPSQASSLCSPFYSPFSEPNDGATEPQRIDNIWSPLWSVMATPPPMLLGSSGAPPTPTPSHGSGVNTMKPISSAIPANVSHLPQPQQQQQQQLQQHQHQLCASGSSPPEAAVEATPETTPMKELLGSAVRPFPVNSPAVRAIWGTSQPTSPLRRDALAAAAAASAGGSAAFRFNMIEAGAAVASAVGIGATGTTASVTTTSGNIKYELPISSPKILNFVNERNMYASQMRDDQQMTAIASAESAMPAATSSNNNVLDNSTISTAAATTLTSDTTPEDAEVTQINSLARPPLPPQSRFKRSPNGNTERSSGQSKCTDTATPSDADEDSATASAGDEDCAGSGANDGENGNSTQKIFARRLQSKRSHFARKIDRITIGTQTIQQLPQTYEQMFLDLLAGTADGAPSWNSTPSDLDTQPTGNAVVPVMAGSAVVPLSPHALLDQLIETAVRKRPPGGGKGAASIDAEQIQLLNLQLQYERYRREVHAERNRRLLGKSRANASLEMDNEKLREQRDKLAAETDELTEALNRARVMRTAQENEHSAEVQRLQRDVHAERAIGAELRTHVEGLQRSVSDERRQRQEAIGALAACKAELFDMRNELAQTQERAEWGVRCREELQRLQHEVMLMGEIQVKCRERLAEVNGWQTREAEAALVRTAYAEEVKEIRATLDTKTAQLDTARARLSELEAHLSRRDSMFTEQKRLLKTVKEEYQDRFRALEAKYTAQKAIILRLEEEMLDLYHRSGASGSGNGALGSGANSGSTQQTPDGDRQSVVGSLDHASPLSVSLASSEGIAMSLRATATEIRNLHPLVVASNVGATTTPAIVVAGAPINQQPGTSNSTVAANEIAAVQEISNSAANRQPVSEDIPVPVASSNPLHIQRSGLHHHHPHHPLNKHHQL